MSKLYIFGIGGTGARVLRSLTMLLASGVKIGTDEIVPIIIDPDAANADLTRAVSLMDNYRSIRSRLSFTPEDLTPFFRTELRALSPGYTLRIEDTDDRLFREFIELSSVSGATGDRTTEAMLNMLFSKDNLNASMDVGFKGNPNIGSVVLNQIIASREFELFAGSFEEGDRIFIISSIFGGTGASGFPLLLKTLRTNKEIANHAYINAAPIGAVTILPYFSLEPDDESEIDSSTFVSKAKSALAYYEKNIVKTNQVDTLYLLADTMNGNYENHEGGSAQQNKAHLMEFLAATAVADFASERFDEEEPRTTISKEFAVKDLKSENSSITFNTFYDKDKGLLFPPMTAFMLLTECLTEKFEWFSSKSFNANNDHFKDLYDAPFMNDLRRITSGYLEWLQEMKENKRSLDLFTIESFSKPFDIVTDMKPKGSLLSFLKDYNLITDRLNSAVRNVHYTNKEENKFLEMFYLATSKLVTEKYSI